MTINISFVEFYGIVVHSLQIFNLSFPPRTLLQYKIPLEAESGKCDGQNNDESEKCSIL